MTWDAELEELAVAVSDLYGDQALSDAMMRALHIASEQSQPMGHRLAVFGAGKLERALRQELRKLLVTH
jgi:hypothetical protein